MREFDEGVDRERVLALNLEPALHIEPTDFDEIGDGPFQAAVHLGRLDGMLQYLLDECIDLVMPVQVLLNECDELDLKLRLFLLILALEYLQVGH